ncbi:MAG: hypothetical protein ACI9Y7_002047 [Dokdonia sp.]|jgi:hypothetical protein
MSEIRRAKNLSNREEIGLFSDEELKRDIAYSLRVIKTWVVFFGILTITSLVIYLFSAFLTPMMES